MNWFKHKSNTRYEPRVKRLIRQFGLEGFGLYMLVMESIAQTLDERDPLPDFKETAIDVADEYNIDIRKVEDMISFCIQHGLFEEVENRIISIKMFELLDEYTGKKTQVKRMIENMKTALVEKNLLTNSEKCKVRSEICPDNIPTDSGDCPDFNRIVSGENPEGIPSVTGECPPRREKKRKEEKRKEEICAFDQFWTLYNKKIGRAKSEKLWSKIKPIEYEKILSHAAQYVTATPDKQFRKNPETYLRNECWNDEVVNSKSGFDFLSEKERIEKEYMGA